MNHKINEHRSISLKGKVAVVAGGSNRTGRAIAERLAESGARVIIADLNLINAEVVVQAIIDKYRTEATAVSLNTMENNAVATTIRAISENWGNVDVWVNANTIFLYQQAPVISEEEPDYRKDSSLQEILISCREVAGHMIASGKKGIIVNIVPVSHFAGVSVLSDPGTSQSSVAAFTKSFSEVVKIHGIKLFAVAPASMHKSGLEKAGGEACFEYTMPDDVARLVLFCISDLSHVMTGKVITLNGNKVFIDKNH